MKLNLEKNFKSLFKKKVSFTMAALTFFAITGAVSFADGGTPDPNINNDVIKNLQEQANANSDNIAGLRNDFNDFSKKQEEVNKKQKIVNDKYEQLVDNLGTKADQNGNNIDVDKYKEKLGLDKLEDRLDTHGSSIKALKGNKVNKDDYELDKKNINEKIDKEIKDRQDHSKIFNDSIKDHDKKINSLTKDVDELLENAVNGEYVKREVEKEAETRKAADKAHDKAIADNKKAIDNEAATREAADKKHDAAIAENKAAIKKYDTAIDTNKKAIADEVKRSTEVDARHDAAIAANKAGIEANASAIKHLDSKLNKTTAMMTAMNNVDFQDVNAGEVAIGAGVGHFVGSQAVAVGVAYGVNDDLKVHAKLSGVAGDAHYNAIGGGVTYKFRTR